MAFLSDDISINTMIGPGAMISGDLRIAGFIRIDGDINGNLETTGRVIIGEKARIKGNITAQTAVIGGIIEGDVVAPDGVELFSTASVLGDIVTRFFKADEDSLFQGQCIAISDEAKYTEAVQNWQNERAIRQKTILTSGMLDDF